MRRAGQFLVCLLLSSCAAFAGKSDYLDYRAVRMERDDRARLLAMQRYTARHPDGRWYSEVQSERQRRDKVVFEAGKSERAGLTLYLAAFPDGELAAQAKSRLAAIAVIEQRKRGELERSERLAQERKHEEAELTRTWVTRFFGYWAKALLSLGNWGASIEQVARGNPQFSRAFGRPPRPRCTNDECVKYYESAYAVPVPGGTRMERTMRLLLRLRMERGQLTRAELLLPGWGFSRWRELEERRPVVDGDAEARKDAVAWVLARVTAMLDTLVPERQAVAGYSLPEIPKPTIGPTGELLDTTAEDPAAPPNHIQGETPASAEPTVTDLVKPTAPEQTPDMEMAPLQVGKDGHSISAGGQAPPQTSPASPEGPVLEMAPLAVPHADGTPGPMPASPQPAVPQQASPVPAPSVPPQTVAFRSGGLRIVFFAAGSDAKAPAYDGFVIERVQDSPARGVKSAAKRAH
jgi:hypothetical protein